VSNTPKFAPVAAANSRRPTTSGATALAAAALATPSATSLAAAALAAADPTATLAAAAVAAAVAPSACAAPVRACRVSNFTSLPTPHTYRILTRVRVFACAFSQLSAAPTSLACEFHLVLGNHDLWIRA
jgi:hypothetical protein